MLPPSCIGRGRSWKEDVMSVDTRVTALRFELRSASNERRAQILAELSQLGILQRAIAPMKETR